MSPTGDRFHQYESQESMVFLNFLEQFDKKKNFIGIASSLQNFVLHPGGTDLYDIECNADGGQLTFEIQISNNFRRYGDLRLDYVSVYRPYSRFISLSEFQTAEENNFITITKWGKIVEPKAKFLICEFRNGKPMRAIYNLRLINERLDYWKKEGKFKTNRKYGEPWGSAFIVIPENDKQLQQTKPKTLNDILSEANHKN